MSARQIKATNYFSHDSNARNDEKVIRLRMKHNAAGYGVYFMILERLRDETGYMSVKDYNMIAFDLRVDAALVKSVVEDFGLFVFTDDGKYFYSDSFKRRMDIKDTLRRQRSEAGKKGNEKRWGGKRKSKQKRETSNVTPTPKAAPAPKAALAEQSDGDNEAHLKRFFSKENQANLKVLLMNLGLKPNDLPKLKMTAKEVVAEWGLASKQHLNYTDWSQHLISLMRIKFTERARAKPGAQKPEKETPPAPVDYDFDGGFGGKDV